MNKLKLIICSLLINTSISIAQPVVWNWNQAMGGSNNNYGFIDITNDSQGNSYITGDFSGTKTFGSITLTASGVNNVFVAKYDPSGNFIWAVRAGGNFSPSNAVGIVYTNGELYVSGSFSNSLECGTIFQNSSGQSSDAFLMKLNPVDGSCFWIENAGGITQDKGFGIEPAISGGVIFSGRFTSTATLDTITLVNPSSFTSNTFLANYLPNGSCLWAKKIETTGNGEVYSFKVDLSGNIILTGAFIDSVKIANGTTVFSAGGADIFLAKLDPSGIFQWSKSIGGTGSDTGQDLGIDQLGNIYLVANYTSNSISFGTIVINDNNAGNIFIAKYSPSGSFLWVQSEGGSQSDFVQSASTDLQGGTYITGGFTGATNFSGTTLTGTNDLYVAKYDYSGALRWVIRAGGANSDKGVSILADSSGFCFVGGYFFGTVAFGSITLTSSPGEWSIFLGRLSGGTVGVNEVTPVVFNLFPNPSSKTVYLSFNQIDDAIFTMDLITTDGKLITTKTLTQSDAESGISFDLTGMTPGNYFIRLNTSRGEYVKSLIVGSE